MFKFIDSWQSGKKVHIKNFKSLSIFCIILSSTTFTESEVWLPFYFQR